MAVLVLCGAGMAWGVENFQKIYPFLIDLAGWNGAAPEGSSFTATEGKTVQATRTYTKGDARMTVVAMVGSGAHAYQSMYQELQMETEEASFTTTRERGCRVMDIWQKKDHTGTLVVLRDKAEGSAVFFLEYEGMDRKDVRPLFEAFDISALFTLLETL